MNELLISVQNAANEKLRQDGFLSVRTLCEMLEDKIYSREPSHPDFDI